MTSCDAKRPPGASRRAFAIRSATEPVNTSTSVGKLLFQLLGSFAEFEKNSMQERLTLGRDRVAKAGKWTGQPIPFGYDVDEKTGLVLSERIVAPIEQTEAEVARTMFERVANGSTLVQEARRLNAFGVLSPRRWSGGAESMARNGAPLGSTRCCRIAFTLTSVC
jgi:site-specific DNA recombinase